jgi:hypothetical protein
MKPLPVALGAELAHAFAQCIKIGVGFRIGHRSSIA